MHFIALQIRAFLGAKPLDDGRHYVIMLDNAPWHKKTFRLVQEEKRTEYEDIRKVAVLEMLPPYSHDLNPIEQVWRITRRENTHNVFFPSLTMLESTVDRAFDEWSKPNEQLRTLCSFE